MFKQFDAPLYFHFELGGLVIPIPYFVFNFPSIFPFVFVLFLPQGSLGRSLKLSGASSKVPS
jgi:hypothetical protein